MRATWLLAASMAAVLTFAAALLLQRKASAPRAAPPQSADALTLELTGKIQPQSIVNVPAPVEGTITEVVASAGQEVSAGQLLGRMESGTMATRRALAQEETRKSAAKVRDLEASLDAARLEASRSQAASDRADGVVDSAEKEYLRQKALMDAGAAPRLVFEKSEQDYAAARADRESLGALAREASGRGVLLARQLNTARSKLPDVAADAEPNNAVAEIHSPVDGVVVSSAAKTGTMVKAETALFQIAVNLATLDVALYPDKKTLARLRTGQSAIVRVAEAGDIAIPGGVRAISDDGVLVGFQSPSRAVRPGLTAIVRMTMSSPN